MKPFILLVFIALGCMTNPVSGQLSVLFVDDTDDDFGNADLFYESLESTGFPITYYNAVDSAQGPSDLLMNAFDLVVWYTSSDGNNLLFWNGLDEDNGALKAYLNGGGKLWLVGLDFLYDRYGVAPTSFNPGDFMYDYIGIQSYDLQSYADDGNLGVPLVNVVDDAPIPGLNNLDWIFATLWYVDGVSLRAEAQPVYKMGDESYSFADSIAAAYFDAGNFQVLSYFFDLSLVESTEMHNTNSTAVLNFFDGMISSTYEPDQSTSSIQVFPNPSADQIQLELELEKPALIQISIVNILGQHIIDFPASEWNAGRNSTSFSFGKLLDDGFYKLRIMIEGVPHIKSIMIQR